MSRQIHHILTSSLSKSFHDDEGTPQGRVGTTSPSLAHSSKKPASENELHLFGMDA